MKNIYERALNNGCFLENTCVGLEGGADEWDELMKGAKRANRKMVTKIAYMAGVIDEDQYKDEIKRPYFNPYNHFKTDTHIIYVHSAIEHFIKVL